MDEELQKKKKKKYSLHLWISARGSVPSLISPSRLVYMNVRDIPDTYHSLSLINSAAHFIFSTGSANLATPLSRCAHRCVFLTSLYFLSFFLSSFLFFSPSPLVVLFRDAAAGPNVLTLTLWIRVNIFSRRWCTLMMHVRRWSVRLISRLTTQNHRPGP